jgi:uncharacterized protein
MRRQDCLRYIEVSSGNELLLFAKAPRLGEVKTRLAQALGAEGALNAYQILLKTLAEQIHSLESVTVCFSPNDGERELRPFFPNRWKFRAQQGGDLGERLTDAIAFSFRGGAERVVVIGSDCPYVSVELIHQAWDWLEQSDVIFGPAEDGGFYLVGLNEAYPQLFENVPWSTEEALAKSLANAHTLGLRTALGPRLPDIDTEVDWLKFLEARRSRFEG